MFGWLWKARSDMGSVYLQGLNDLHNAFVPAFPTSQKGMDQPGTPLYPGLEETYEQRRARYASQPRVSDDRADAMERD